MTTPTPSLPEVRRLCATLAAGRHAAEIGTLYGDGAAAIAATAASLVTIEPDPDLAATARGRLPREVEVVCADWRVLLERDPFEFVFVDGGGEETVSVEIRTTPETAAIVAVRR